MSNTTTLPKITRICYYEMLKQDRRSILEIMTRNYLSDLEAGYDYFGKSLTDERFVMEQYARQTRDIIAELDQLDERTRERKARAILKKSGAID